MSNAFESPFLGRRLDEQVTNPNIRGGRYSYYSGWYHGHGFDDCARYLLADRDDVDRLIVGSFCSIGSRAVVTRDVAPYAVVAGNPAREIRKRFDDAAIAQLLELRWWDWPLERIRAALPLLTAGDIPALHALWTEQERKEPTDA